MEYENLIMRIIMRYQYDKGSTEISPDDAWEIAKRISLVSKPKGRDEIKRNFNNEQADRKRVGDS